MSVLDSSIFGPLFGDTAINALFSDQAYVRALVDVEIALARAEARVGVIPAGRPPGIVEQLHGVPQLQAHDFGHSVQTTSKNDSTMA